MHGIKAGAYSESKYSNWTRFSPVDSEVNRVYDKYYEKIQSVSNEPLFFQEQLHNRFILPITPQDLKKEYSKIPAKLREGLKGVFLLGGTAKIENTSKSNFRYGTYWNSCIFLHPYPRERMEMRYIRAPRPHVLNDYKRVGADIKVLNNEVLI